MALLPGWPRVPRQLWLTGAAISLVALSLGLRQEIWPHHPQAVRWHSVVLVLLMVAAGLQAIKVLWHWPTEYSGPALFRLVFRGIVLATCAGIAGLVVVATVLFSIWIIGLTRVE
ncbi:hypothetical protein [Hymenobacter sp. B1770]|uniref:hypothetical protein n=1 Tax=Hymenobacter sp. B1770 TaxID=1718788 RepID=UPI003CF45382